MWWQIQHSLYTGVDLGLQLTTIQGKVKRQKCLPWLSEGLLSQILPANLAA